MKILIISFILACSLSVILILISLIFSKKSVLDREKACPFECGFDPKNLSRAPFSVRFYLIAIVFLIFDIEIAVLLPLGVVSNSLPPLTWIFAGTFFLLFVTLGLLYEWMENTLDWIV